MPGKRITDLQVTKYKEHRGKQTQEAAAAKAGISVSSARRLESQVTLPPRWPARNWRTRTDPWGRGSASDSATFSRTQSVCALASKALRIRSEASGLTRLVFIVWGSNYGGSFAPTGFRTVTRCAR